METLLSPTETKAVKEHSCSFCGIKIRVGEKYFKSTHKFDGRIYDWKSHKHCSELATKLNMYDGADDGVTQDDFMEIIGNFHDDTLINLLPEDKNKYGDIIRQLRNVRWIDKLGYVIRHFAKL